MARLIIGGAGSVRQSTQVQPYFEDKTAPTFLPRATKSTVKSVLFGQAEATELQVLSMTELAVTTPANKKGAAVVKLIGVDDQEATLPKKFVYQPDRTNKQ